MATTVGTSTVTVNAAYMQEIKEAHQELWDLVGTVQYLRGQPHQTRGKWRYCVEMLSRLRDQLALHFTLEEAYGYFDDPGSVAPQLNRAAQALRKEHSALYRDVCQSVDCSEQVLYNRKSKKYITLVIDHRPPERRRD